MQRVDHARRTAMASIHAHTHTIIKSSARLKLNNSKLKSKMAKADKAKDSQSLSPLSLCHRQYRPINVTAITSYPLTIVDVGRSPSPPTLPLNDWSPFGRTMWPTSLHTSPPSSHQKPDRPWRERRLVSSARTFAMLPLLPPPSLP